MTDPKPCPDYRSHMDHRPWRVTAGTPDGAYASAWTCDRHLTSTLLWAQALTGQTAVIVPSNARLAALHADLAKLPRWAELTAVEIYNVGDPNPPFVNGDRCPGPHVDGWTCTRQKGHGGQHVAGTSGGTIAATWCDPDEATP